MATVNGEKNVIIISIFENFSQLNTKKIMNYGKASHKICIIYQYLGILTIAKYSNNSQVLDVVKNGIHFLTSSEFRPNKCQYNPQNYYPVYK